MSKWHEVTDKSNIGVSEDFKMLQVKFDTDNDGSVWVEIPLKLIQPLRVLSESYCYDCMCMNCH